MGSLPVTIRPLVEDDWRQAKALRLEMLADTPLAYLETLEQAESHPDEFWRNRARRGLSDRSITVVAITRDGRWVGSMTALVDQDGGDPWLVAVYVAAEVRGGEAGVTDALLARIEEWARERGSGLRLEVNEENPRAIAAYRKRGFAETGRSRPYPLDPRLRELEMRKPLTLTGN
jgi:ribosomal protein S18 acetylase RimI-like enzyme